VHLALIIGDDIDALQEHRLHGGLPGPEAQRIIRERRIIRVEHQCRTAFRMADKIGVIHLAQAPVSLAKPPSRKRCPDAVTLEIRESGLAGRLLLSVAAMAGGRDALMTP